MTHTHAPYRVDHVGSFLRPVALAQAREDFAAGKMMENSAELIGIWISSGALGALIMSKLLKVINSMMKQPRRTQHLSLEKSQEPIIHL